MAKTRTMITINTINYDYLKSQCTNQNGMSAVVDRLVEDSRDRQPILDRIQEQVAKLDRLALELSPFTLQQIMKKRSLV